MSFNRTRRCGPWSRLTEDDRRKIREAMDAADEAKREPEKVDPRTGMTDRQLFIAARGGPK